MKVPVVLFLLIGAFFCWQWAHYEPLLPDTVATHFGVGGRADGWSSSATLFPLYALLLVLCTLPFLALPYLLQRLPNSVINMPHKDYWLAPERRAETLAWLGGQLQWFGVWTAAFVVLVFELLLRANLMAEPRLSNSFLWGLGAYVLLTLVWTARLILTFYRKPPATA